MSDNQKDNRNQNSGNMSKEKTNVGFDKKNENHNDTQKKQQTPNEEVPNIGDHEKRNLSKAFDKKGPSNKPDAYPSKDHGKQKNERDEDREIKNQGKIGMEEEQPEEQESK